jgi:hypothetical protein
MSDNGLKYGMAFYHCDTVDFESPYVTVIVTDLDIQYVETSPLNPGVDFNFQLSDRIEAISSEIGIQVMRVERSPGHILH